MEAAEVEERERGLSCFGGSHANTWGLSFEEIFPPENSNSFSQAWPLATMSLPMPGPASSSEASLPKPSSPHAWDSLSIPKMASVWGLRLSRG